MSDRTYGSVTGSVRVLADCECGWPLVFEHSYDGPIATKTVHCAGCDRYFYLSVSLMMESYRDFYGGRSCLVLQTIPPAKEQPCPPT